MRTYTTCASCGGPLRVQRHRHDTHDRCPRSGDYITGLEQQLFDAVLAGDDALADQLAEQVDAYERRPPQYLAAALAYAAWGWPVFPCRPGLKTPATAHGFHEASTDPDQIRVWWACSPAANVGLATGVAFDVLDVDPAGLLAWARHREVPEHPDGDIHGEVSTPRGGKHVYLRPTGEGNLAGFAPGLDYRGRGGYVLAPPSTLVPAALKGPIPGWPLRYSWWIRPSPTLTGQGAAS